VVDASEREVRDSSTALTQRQKPIFLVTVPKDGLIERSETFKCAAANREISSPDHGDLTVIFSQVQRRDWRRLTPARAGWPALEACPDRAAENLRLRVAVNSLGQRCKPAWGHPYIVVEERDQRRSRRPNA
jgi:hypothetical protein